MHRLCSLILIVVAHISATAQTEVPYFEVIEGDSVKLYMEYTELLASSRNNFTGKGCAKAYRLTRVSSDGKFEGRFVDFSTYSRGGQPMRLAEGAYLHGRKEGKFIIYYEDGSVKSEGSYAADVPIGDWKFFTGNGNVSLVLRFDGSSEPLLDYMYDEYNKRVMVKDGTGEARFISNGEVSYAVSGRIKGGLPDGLWIGEADVMAGGGNRSKWMRRETYKEGMMVKGEKIQSGRITDVCCDPLLSKIFPTPELRDILHKESFPIEPCAGPPFMPPGAGAHAAPRSAQPVSGYNTFQSSVKAIILQKYSGREVGEGFNPTTPGTEENVVVIHFNTDEKGQPVHLRLSSAYGREFYQPLKRALQSQVTFQPNQTKLVLTVFVQATPNIFRYRIVFSLG